MFRFNNPDALLVTLTVLAAYGLVRALEQASTRWLALSGAVLGLAFLAKMFQAFLVLPVFAAVYLLAAPTPLRRRLWQLMVAGGALVAAAGWWVAVVALTPAADRPYVGGSTGNSVLDLIWGYNGLGRIDGGSQSGPGGGFSGSTGIGRLFNSLMGGQISWLLPAALLALVAGLWAGRRAPRTTVPAPRSSSSAAGSSSAGSSTATRAGSFTPTTPTRSPPRSPRSSASARCSSGMRGDGLGRASRWPRCSG
jgi:4-amino-4-deoxy-L-arabinose transferase-like glycosyltransferase